MFKMHAQHILKKLLQNRKSSWTSPGQQVRVYTLALGGPGLRLIPGKATKNTELELRKLSLFCVPVFIVTELIFRFSAVEVSSPVTESSTPCFHLPAVSRGPFFTQHHWPCAVTSIAIALEVVLMEQLRVMASAGASMQVPKQLSWVFGSAIPITVATD